MIDVVKTSLAYNLATWSKGEIVSILGKADLTQPNLGNDSKGPLRFKVKYHLDSSCTDKIVDADSKDIAMFDSMTSGDEWRANLKQGDQIDYYDQSQLKWQNATVISVPNFVNIK